MRRKFTVYATITSSRAGGILNKIIVRKVTTNHGSPKLSSLGPRIVFPLDQSFKKSLSRYF